MTNWKLGAVVVLILIVGLLLLLSHRSPPRASLWDVYDESLKGAKYVDLTHTINPSVPVWHGFGPSKFAPTADPATNRPYSYEKDGFEATHYDLATDQLGTQLDPPLIGIPTFRPSMSSQRPTPSGRSWSFRSKTRQEKLRAIR